MRYFKNGNDIKEFYRVYPDGSYDYYCFDNHGSEPFRWHRSRIIPMPIYFKPIELTETEMFAEML